MGKKLLNSAYAACIVSLLLFVTLPQLAMARVKFGVMGGTSFSKVNVDTDSDAGIKRPNRIGFNVGGIVEFQISSRFFVCIEPTYAEKGSKTDFPSQGDGFESTLEFNYFLLPVHLKARFGHGNIRPYLFVGPYWGYATKMHLVMRETGEVINEEDYFKRSDLGIEMGAGLEIPIAKMLSVVVDGRYSIGLININRFSLSKFKNRGMLVMVGCLLEF